MEQQSDHRIHKTEENKAWLVPLFPSLLIGLALFIGGFIWGNRSPLVTARNIPMLLQDKQPVQKLDFDSVNQINSLLHKNFDGELKVNDLNIGLRRGLVGATGDPYTEYFTAKEAQQFEDDLSGRLSGVGIELGKKNNQLVVIAPISGAPAVKAGVRAGDAIIGVDNQDTSNWSVDQAANKIRGEAGTKVKLTIVRSGNVKHIEIVRANITVPSVEFKILDNNIGYLKLSRFSEDTTSLATKAAQSFKDHKVKGVILDLRDNGGGLLNTAVDISGLWLNNKVVVTEKVGGKVQDTLYSDNRAILKDIPTIVLVNGGSASASEITAGALRDNGVAKLVGQTTFGKGSVQQTLQLRDGGLLKVTVAHWYTPNNVNINKSGIKPDIEVELTDEDYNANRDPQKDTAIKQLLK